MIALDGNPADMATIVAAACAAAVRPARRSAAASPLPHFDMRWVIVDFMNGLLIVPFCLLIGSVFSSALLQTAVTLNRGLFAEAGFIALAFVMRELFGPDRGPFLSQAA